MKTQSARRPFALAAVLCASLLAVVQATQAAPSVPYSRCQGENIKITFDLNEGSLMAGLYLGEHVSGALCSGTGQALHCQGADGSASVDIAFGSNKQAVVKVSPSIFWPLPWSRSVTCQ